MKWISLLMVTPASPRIPIQFANRPRFFPTGISEEIFRTYIFFLCCQLMFKNSLVVRPGKSLARFSSLAEELGSLFSYCFIILFILKFYLRHIMRVLPKTQYEIWWESQWVWILSKLVTYSKVTMTDFEIRSSQTWTIFFSSELLKTHLSL